MVQRWKTSAANHSVILNADVSKSIIAISLEEDSFEFSLLLLSAHQMELLQRKWGRTCNEMRLLIELAAIHRHDIFISVMYIILIWYFSQRK